MDNRRCFRFEKKAKKRKKNGLVVFMSWEANAKGGNYVEVFFDDCGQRFPDHPLRNGVA
jgi:hypothetical protein